MSLMPQLGSILSCYLDEPLHRLEECGSFVSSERLIENPLEDIDQVAHGRLEVHPGLGRGFDCVETLPGSLLNSPPRTRRRPPASN